MHKKRLAELGQLFPYGTRVRLVKLSPNSQFAKYLQLGDIGFTSSGSPRSLSVSWKIGKDFESWPVSPEGGDRLEEITAADYYDAPQRVR